MFAYGCGLRLSEIHQLKIKHLDFWSDFDYNMYKNNTKRTSEEQVNKENPIFEMIKNIFSISNKKTKKYVLTEFYSLKNIARAFDETDE